MDAKMLAPLAAVIFVGIVITAAAIELTRKDTPPAEHGFAPMATPPSDPLRAALKRCQLIGEAGRSDPVCLRAWTDNRERFLGHTANETATPDAPSSPNAGPNPWFSTDEAH